MYLLIDIPEDTYNLITRDHVSFSNNTEGKALQAISTGVRFSLDDTENIDTIQELRDQQSAFNEKFQPHNDKVNRAYDRVIAALKHPARVAKMLEIGINSTSGDDDYSMGIRNGIRWAKSVLTGESDVEFEHSKSNEVAPEHSEDCTKFLGEAKIE